MDTPDLAAVQLAVGERYEVLEVAGAGGMGVVYRARHSALGNMVAIKVLPPEVAESGMRLERFKREAGLAAHLSHPNIVPVFEFEQRDGVSYLIMPFVRGHSLDSALSAGARLAPVDLMRVLVDIGAALDFVHPRGVIHRDVKPANIMIEDDTGRALLTDFGVAYVSPTPSGALTAVGSAIGTPDYMAPEQAIGRRIDGRADLYALAIVAYEALTGTLPMLSTSPDAPARALHTARPEIALRVAAALMAPLAQQPDDRPASAAQWLAQIKRASSGARRQAALLGAAVVVALGIVGAFALRRPEAAAGPPSVAVMPFTTLGPKPYPVEDMAQWFLGRLSERELFEYASFEQVLAQTGRGPVTRAKADSVAHQLGTKYFLNPVSLLFRGDSVFLAASLYVTGRPEAQAKVEAEGPVDALTAVMDTLWAKILGAAGAEFSPNAYATIPLGKEAIAAYFNADKAFRHAKYETARALYDTVIARDPDFAPAYLRRVLVLAQVAPKEDSLRVAMLGARRHWAGLTPSDSLLLDGYVQLVEHGDGMKALEQFRVAVASAPGSIWARFALAEFYYYFGQLFNQPPDSARAAFDSVLALDKDFAAAIASSISLAHLFQENELAKSLILRYQRIDSTSLVAEVIGLADTLVFQPLSARAGVSKKLATRKFLVLEFLAFQAAQFGTDDDRRGPGRRILAALQHQASTPYERILALRLGLAADLRVGLVDTARVRLASTGADATERDAWLMLAHAAGVDSLGDWTAARQRLARGRTDTSATLSWLFGDAGALERLFARDSSPLAWSLARDLEARSLLAHGDTTAALAHWDEATRRYSVLAAPFGLVASLWPLRRDLVLVAIQVGDTAKVKSACRSFDAIVGFVDQIVQPGMKEKCKPWNALGP